MANDYYTHGTYPTTGASGSSSAMRAELDLVTAGFALLPGLTGNGSRVPYINALGTAQTTAANFTYDGTNLLAGTFNKVTLTAPAAGSTLTILNGKTLTVNKTLTLDGTDGQTMTFPSTSATIARTDAAQSFTGLQTFGTGITSTAASNSFGATVFSGNITSSGNPSLNIGSGALTCGTVNGTVGFSSLPSSVQFSTAINLRANYGVF